MSSAGNTYRFPLETHSDAAGTVALGWLGGDVLFSRLEGGLSAELGAAYATSLQKISKTVPAIHLYSDARALTHYDLLARSAFVRVVLADRRRFASVSILTWSEGVSRAAQSVAATLGGNVQILTNAVEFERRLLQASPLAIRVCSASESEQLPARSPATR